MPAELLEKLRMQKKFRNLKTIQKVLGNATQLEAYLTGQNQPLTDDIDTLPANGFIHVDKDLHYLFETDPINNSTRVTEIRSGDIQIAATIQDNFFYQHMFNFALVVILLLQVFVVWAFIWCRLSKYGNQEFNQLQPIPLDNGIALRDVGQLPEIFPDQHREDNERIDIENRGVALQNRCGRYG